MLPAGLGGLSLHCSLCLCPAGLPDARLYTQENSCRTFRFATALFPITQGADAYTHKTCKFLLRKPKLFAQGMHLCFGEFKCAGRLNLHLHRRHREKPSSTCHRKEPFCFQSARTCYCTFPSEHQGVWIFFSLHQWHR